MMFLFCLFKKKVATFSKGKVIGSLFLNGINLIFSPRVTRINTDQQLTYKELKAPTLEKGRLKVGYIWERNLFQAFSTFRFRGLLNSANGSLVYELKWIREPGDEGVFLSLVFASSRASSRLLSARILVSARQRGKSQRLSGREKYVLAAPSSSNERSNIFNSHEINASKARTWRTFLARLSKLFSSSSFAVFAVLIQFARRC